LHGGFSGLQSKEVDGLGVGTPVGGAGDDVG